MKQIQYLNTQSIFPILDDGHGTETPGKRAPDNSMLENEFNETVMHMLSAMLYDCGIKHYLLAGEDKDIGLTERIRREKAIAALHPGKTILVSIHANAHGGENIPLWNDANGIETLYFSESGKVIAQDLQNRFIKETGLKNRGIKHRTNLTILKDSASPSVLLELGFMTNKEELALLKSNEYRYLCASIIRDYFVDQNYFLD